MANKKGESRGFKVSQKVFFFLPMVQNGLYPLRRKMISRLQILDHARDAVRSADLKSAKTTDWRIFEGCLIVSLRTDKGRHVVDTAD